MSFIRESAHSIICLFWDSKNLTQRSLCCVYVIVVVLIYLSIFFSYGQFILAYLRIYLCFYILSLSVSLSVCLSAFVCLYDVCVHSHLVIIITVGMRYIRSISVLFCYPYSPICLVSRSGAGCGATR